MNTPTLLYPTADLDTTLHFLRDTLGLTVEYRDGERFASLAAGAVTLALLGAEERIVDSAALAIPVENIDAAVIHAVASGARILRPVERGPHEKRAVIQLPGSVAPIVLSARLDHDRKESPADKPQRDNTE